MVSIPSDLGQRVRRAPCTVFRVPSIWLKLIYLPITVLISKLNRETDTFVCPLSFLPCVFPDSCVRTLSRTRVVNGNRRYERVGKGSFGTMSAVRL